jgi:15-cis-phytoene synthase
VEPKLVEGYRECARLTWRYGTTYFWGAVLLPRRRRRHVYAIYALCRLADDIIDLPDTDDPATVQAQLDGFEQRFRTALVERGSDEPVLAAIVSTVVGCGIEPECFERFFGAMRMDLTVTSYRTWQDLCGYMEGSAAVIGEMMLPVLEPRSPEAKAPARSLGLAFQLTNFLRDVDEDLDRGRVYLPMEDVERFGVDLLASSGGSGGVVPPSVNTRRATREFQALMAYEIERNRALYDFADTGIAMLPPRSARCVGTARVLYSQILDRIERQDYDVFRSRARVPTPRKAITAARIMVLGPRRPSGHWQLERSRRDVTSHTH